MEWVETTSKSIEDAKALALDQLGVDESEAEIEVLEEPRQGMFGRVRGEARVKARIRPTAPPAKGERARKGKKRSGSASADRSQGGGRKSGNGGAPEGDKTQEARSSKKQGSSGRGDQAPAKRDQANGNRANDGQSKGAKRPAKADREPMPEAEQRAVGEEFLNGLLESMGLSGTVSSELDEDGLLSFEIEGDQLGLLMGPGLNTLDAIQEVCRNAIQRQADGREYGKVVLDVSSARRDRAEALEKFVRDEASQVSESGEEVIFEVMSRADRKIVHDVVADIDGVATESVGEDPRRRVVLRSN
ncbi:MAG: Jag N-terminal domain-containing protein [Microthrixaceae bacterium]|nr:Jag N-terminal domain-containing protein [Microthrixaceae bacterium]